MVKKPRHYLEWRQSGRMWRSCPRDPVEKPLTVTGPGILHSIPWRIPLSPLSPTEAFSQVGFSFPFFEFLIMFFAYIIKSMKDQGYYFGHCENIETRLIRHNQGRVRSTKGRIPFTLHYFESFNTKSEAYKREQFFKSFEGRQWLKNQGII